MSLCARDQFERVAMLWANDTEVAVVQGGDSCGSEAFSDGDDAGVGATEAQILVAVDQLANAFANQSRSTTR